MNLYSSVFSKSGTARNLWVTLPGSPFITMACLAFVSLQFGSAAWATDLGNGNTADGHAALQSNTTGGRNTAIGASALYFNTVASGSTAVGYTALKNSNGQAGTVNTAVGGSALGANTTGSNNTATGFLALRSNITANDNTATGHYALARNTTGTQNTASGSFALSNNTTGGNNAATGYNALLNNTGGYSLTADGAFALNSNTTGAGNTASGGGALFSNTAGSNNAAVGVNALYYNVSGNNNVALGNGAGQNVQGDGNIIIGAFVSGNANDTNVTRIGTPSQTKAFVAGISGKTVASGVGVIINSQGQLGTVQSSARFKDEIKPMDNASEALLKLKPVTFRYKEQLDPDRIPQFGLIAEEVEKVNPDLVVRGEDGKLTTVRYEAVNAMLLNEFLKEHRTVQELQGKAGKQNDRIAELEAALTRQQKQIETLTAGLQKVNVKAELRSPIARTAVKN